MLTSQQNCENARDCWVIQHLVCSLLDAVIRWPGCLPEGNGKAAFASDLQLGARVLYVLYFVPSLDTAPYIEKGYSYFIICGSTVGVKMNLDLDISTTNVQFKMETDMKFLITNFIQYKIAEIKQRNQDFISRHEFHVISYFKQNSITETSPGLPHRFQASCACIYRQQQPLKLITFQHIMYIICTQGLILRCFVLRLFYFNTSFHFTPHLNLRPLVFGLTLFGWFISTYLSPFSSGNTMFDLSHFLCPLFSSTTRECNQTFVQKYVFHMFLIINVYIFLYFLKRLAFILETAYVVCEVGLNLYV